MKKQNVFKTILVITLILLIIVVVLELVSYKKTYYPISSRVEKVEEEQKQNEEDVLGWIRVQGTNIDYPIIRRKHLEESENTKDYTWMRYHTESIQNRMVIFGHNIQNVSRYPLITNPNHTRFEQLLSFIYTDFAKENQYIQLTIGKKDYLYRIYAVYFEKNTDLGNNLLKKDMGDYIEQAQQSSYFDFGVDVKDRDKLLTLITCTRFFGPTSDYEFKVEARMVRKIEKVKQNTVVEKKTYQKIKQMLKEGEKNAKM